MMFYFENSTVLLRSKHPVVVKIIFLTLICLMSVGRKKVGVTKKMQRVMVPSNVLFV